MGSQQPSAVFAALMAELGALGGQRTSVKPTATFAN